MVHVDELAPKRGMSLRDIWTCCRYPREVHARTEKKAECEATVVKHADVLSLFDIFRQVMSDLACRDIRHADVDGCHQADVSQGGMAIPAWNICIFLIRLFI